MGVTTAAEVCNLALVAIGHTSFIDDLDEDSAEAAVAKAIYATARDACLERFAWKFAALRKALADLGEAAVRDGWDFAYALPADCITPRAIVLEGVRAPSPEQRIPFDVEADASALGRGNVDGRVLLTDQEDAWLIYTARVETVSLFSPLFVKTLSWDLAAGFALGVQKKPAVAMQMTAQYERALLVAEAGQLRGAREDRPTDSEFITGRG